MKLFAFSNLRRATHTHRIVANICMFEEFHEAVIQSGWVTLLVPYTRSQELRSRMEVNELTFWNKVRVWAAVAAAARGEHDIRKKNIVKQ